jgi:pectinesterase
MKPWHGSAYKTKMHVRNEIINSNNRIKMKTKAIALLLLFMTGTMSSAQNNRQNRQDDYLERRWSQVATQMEPEWYGSDDARRVAETVLSFQKEIGGWEKNQPYHQLEADSLKSALLQKTTRKSATIDNGSTITELRFLANMHAQTKDGRYRKAFEKGVQFILAAQYRNGGWPQYYPVRSTRDEISTDKTMPYSMHITYNDNAMVNVMRFLRDIYSDNEAFRSLDINQSTRKKARKAFEKGIDCILNTQIRIDNQPTVWCAQHDEKTLAPANARAYELVSFSGSESAGITLLLMEIDNPSKRVIEAVNGAVKWFDTNKIEGIRLERIINEEGQKDLVVVKDQNAPPIWGRFNDLETGKPFFCSRDGIKRETMAEISHERRNGYGWYTYAPAEVLKQYPAWQKTIISQQR